MPKRPATPPLSSAIAITCSGNIVTVTCGTVSQTAACASPGSAKSLTTRLKNDPQFLKRWMGFKPVTQLPLPLDIARRVVEVPTIGPTPTTASGGLIEEP